MLKCKDCKKQVNETIEHLHCNSGKRCTDCKAPFKGYGIMRYVVHKQDCAIWLSKLLRRQGVEL